ncbi:MAG: amino acid adenylation domain-containing protein [Nostoc sp.]|uniref:amino acid adenylation domain-containing protein n=1 Tax=Nostoc sp. TaxID=1180 RepID=UPI002FFB1241
MVDRSEQNKKARWKAVQALLTTYRKGLPLQAIARSENQSLSFGQERLWLLNQFGGDNTVYNMPFAFWINGSLDLYALEKSIQEIVRRHDILRTTFLSVGAQAVPVIAPKSDLRLSVTDLRQLPPAEQEARYQCISQDEISKPFDLAQGSLWRFQLLQFTEEKYVLLMTIHHIIYDGWSQSVFTKELSILYKDFSSGQSSSLPDLPIQYADFAHWQRQWLTGEILQSQRSYWQQQLAGDLPTLHLPFELPQAVQTSSTTYKGERQPVEFSPHLTVALKQLGDRQGVTLFVVLLAALNVLLYQYTQQQDIIVCSTQAGRNIGKVQGLIGFFNTVVPVRTDLSGNPSFLDLVDRIHQVVLDGYQHQDMPLQLLADTSYFAHKRLYQVMLVLQNTPSELLTLPGVQVESQYLSNGTANFDLFLSLISLEKPVDQLTGYLEYKTELFTPSAIAKLLENFQELLANLVENPHQQLSDLPLFMTDEQQLSLLADLSKESTKPFVGPRTPIERQLAQIWSDVLGREQISIYDNFFGLGGHSLLATQVISRVNTAFGAELPILPIFQHPTIAALAEAIAACLQQELGITSLKIELVRRENKLPLSFSQQQLWFLDRFGSSVAYNLPMALVFTGALKVTALHQTLQEIVDRHESLRTTFSADDGTPYQMIHSQMAIALPVVDLSSWEPEEVRLEVKRLLVAEANCPFNLSQDPMLRATLLHLGQSPFCVDATSCDRLNPSENHHILLLTIHHIAADGWSLNILLKELTALYSAFSQDLPSPLTDLSIQYADFAIWQRQWLQKEVLEEQLSYWKQQLADSSVLNLPTDYPRPVIQTFNGKKEVLELPKFLLDELKALAQREGVTLFMTLLAAFQVLLHRYSQQDDIVVGSPIASRNRQEWEPLIGMFVNTLVLRTDLGGNPSFNELLQRVREVAISAYAHQDLPFEKLVEEVRSQRDASRNPMFQVMFALENASTAALELPELKLELMTVETKTSMFDLTLSLEETASGITGSFEYNTDLFDTSTIKRMAGHFQVLLEGIIASPEQRLSNLPLLTPAEENQILVQWNCTQSEYHQDRCLHQLFEMQVKRTPDQVAVVFGFSKLTYQQLNTQANQLAHYLRSLGVGANVLVGVCVERSLEMLVGLLGILKAGGAYVPLDPDYPKERLSFMLSDSQVSVLLTQNKLVNQLPEHRAYVICLDTDWEKISYESEQNPVSETVAENLAYVIYTSGSTGRPKGVMVTHRNLVNAYMAWEDAYQLRSCTSHLQMASFSFDVFSGDMIRALCSGAKLVICPREWLLEPEKLYKLMQKQKVDCAEFVPPVLRNLIQYLEKTQQNLTFMKLLIVGSDSWYVQEYRQFQHFLGAETRLIHGYGVTEATIDSLYFENTSINLFVDGLVPIGRPFANTKIYVLDRNLQPVPIGVPGELYISGMGLARGYLNQPELTEQKFIRNHFSLSNELGTRLYKTGDLARYLSDGNIELLGRLDYQVKIRGFRIELGEIESVLGQYPNVQNVMVVARPEENGSSGLVAYLTPQFADCQIWDLRNYLKQRLPGYMIPSAFVTLEQFPQTPNGKVDRKALPVPTILSSAVYAPPYNQAEEKIAAAWRQVLNREKLSIHDNFFEVGGHSLLVVQVHHLLSSDYPSLKIVDLFTYPSIHSMANYLLHPLGFPISTAKLNSHVTIQQTAKGRGVFATKKFVQGETVVVGIPIEEVLERTIYSFQMDFNLHVNLDEPAVIINHSCDPNTGVRNNQFGGYNFIALEDIEAGKEITWNYETTEYESIAVLGCLCGSLSCRGKTLGFKFREQILRDTYGEYIAAYLKISSK